MNIATMTFKEGQVVLQWPSNMSPESFDDFQCWLALIVKQVERTVGKQDVRDDAVVARQEWET